MWLCHVAISGFSLPDCGTCLCSVTAPFKPPDKLLGSKLKRGADASANKGAAADADDDLAHTADVSKLAKQVAAEWRDASTPATTGSDAPISDTVPFFPGAPGTSGRPLPSDSGHMDGRSAGLNATGIAVSGHTCPQENVYWPPPGFGQSGAPAHRNAERHPQPLSQPPAGAVDLPALPDSGVGTSGPLQGLKNLLVGSRGSSRGPASPIQPKGYIQLADVVNNLSGMQTGGQLPQSPVAPGAKLSAITPPDVVSTTNGDGHSENGMLAAFTILGDCFQMIEVCPVVSGSARQSLSKHRKQIHFVLAAQALEHGRNPRCRYHRDSKCRLTAVQQ